MATVILEVQARGLHQYHRLEQFPVHIGRAFDNDIILSDHTVSPHHLRLERDAAGQLVVYNLSSENGTRLNRQRLGQQGVPAPLPSELQLGNRRLRLLSSDMPVEDAQLARCAGWFKGLCQPVVAIALLLASLGVGLFDEYLNTAVRQDALFYLSRVLEELLWTVAIALGMAAVVRAVLQRWEFVPALGIVSLFNLLPPLLEQAAKLLGYAFTSELPSLLLETVVGQFLLLPLLLYLFLRWVLSQPRSHAWAAALLLSALPLGLQAVNLLSQFSSGREFSGEPDYHKTLSSLNWHVGKPLDIDAYLEKATAALPAQVDMEAEESAK